MEILTLIESVWRNVWARKLLGMYSDRTFALGIIKFYKQLEHSQRDTRIGNSQETNKHKDLLKVKDPNSRATHIMFGIYDFYKFRFPFVVPLHTMALTAKG